MAPPQGLRSRLAHHATRSLVRFLLASYWQPQPQSWEKIPARGPLLVACNHPTLLDPLLLVALFPRRLDILMAKEVRALPLIGRAFHESGHVTTGAGCLDECLRQLDQGLAIGLFPEGRHTYSDQLADFHSGIAVLAKQSQAPVLPVAILGNQHYLSPRATTIKGGPVRISVGQPLHYRHEESLQSFQIRLREAIAEEMDAIREPRPWSPNWRYRLAKTFWIPISRATFAIIDRLKPDNIR